MVLALCVLVHLARHDLRGARRPECRPRSWAARSGNWGFAAFYARFRDRLRGARAGRAGQHRAGVAGAGASAGALAGARLRLLPAGQRACARSMRWWRHDAPQRFARPRASGLLGVPGPSRCRAWRSRLSCRCTSGRSARRCTATPRSSGFLRFTDRPLFKFAEWGLVVLLALHMMGGVRLLIIEFGSARGCARTGSRARAGVRRGRGHGIRPLALIG